MTPDELKKRSKQFALRVIKLYRSLPKGRDAEVIGMQLLRAATSVGANYRAACRARSDADFISKITIVEKESDEPAYWIELFIESGIASGNTAKSKNNNPKFKIRNPK
jgi:four helix bundle protein